MTLNVDWTFIKTETEGEIPVPYWDENGVTIGVGVRITNRTDDEMSWFDSKDPTLKTKLEPFRTISGDYSVVGGMYYLPRIWDYRFQSTTGAIGAIVNANPDWFPLDVTELETLFEFAQWLTENEAEPRFNAQSRLNCQLDMMEQEVQTVFIDSYHQFGNFGPGGRDWNLWTQLVNGDWPGAITNFRTWIDNGAPPTWQHRNEARANLLEDMINDSRDRWPCDPVQATTPDCINDSISDSDKNMIYYNIRNVVQPFFGRGANSTIADDEELFNLLKGYLGSKFLVNIGDDESYIRGVASDIFAMLYQFGDIVIGDDSWYEAYIDFIQQARGVYAAYQGDVPEFIKGKSFNVPIINADADWGVMVSWDLDGNYCISAVQDFHDLTQGIPAENMVLGLTPGNAFYSTPQPPAIRMGVDASVGHCFPPRPADSGSPNVFVNGIAVVRVGDHYPTHSCPPYPPHDGNASVGSSTVFVNGKALHRNGDAISCGDTATNGSPNVFVG